MVEVGAVGPRRDGRSRCVHLPVGIDADHAGADAGQARLGEAAAFVDLLICGDERVALRVSS